MRSQVIEKPSEPRCFTVGIRPYLNVLIHALKYGTAKLQFRIDAMERSREVKIERCVIFGQHVLTVRFFSHLDVRDWIATFFEICNLRCGIFRSGVNQSNRNHGGQSAGVAAGVEEVESNLFPRGWTKVGGACHGSIEELIVAV